MKRASFLMMALLMAFFMSCNQASKNSQQPSFGPGGGMGGGNFDPQAMIDRQMDELKEGLQLSDDQEKQVREIITSGFETMRKAREEMQDGGDREAMREKMQQMREEQNVKIKAVLSEEQFTKYEQIQEERRQRMRQGGGPGGPGRQN